MVLSGLLIIMLTIMLKDTVTNVQTSNSLFSCYMGRKLFKCNYGGVIH